jgi:CRISPR-associated protein Cmr1
MKNFISRYLRRESFKLECVTVTPMFHGKANQEAEWRAEPFKALLRYWWRVSQPDSPRFEKKGNQDLLKRESELFGYAGDLTAIKATKSLIHVEIESTAQPSSQQLSRLGLSEIDHPEMRNTKTRGKVDPLVYLACMGLMKTGGEVLRSYFPAGSRFTLIVQSPADRGLGLNPVIALIQAFGAIGGRCRNGWGSFQLVEGGLDADKACELLNSLMRPWHDGFEKDYPNCLGRDTKGPLLWKTEPQNTWALAMRELAQAYVWLRAGNETKGVGALKADGHDHPDERHLLGFPLTNHEANRSKGWGREGRHASPLRFVVRKKGDMFQGFVLHLPHLHSTEMTLPEHLGQPGQQIAVWKKVHESLHKLLRRAMYKECL